jgi:Glyoxalase/Bleomycin resistance protein/Dioxygenase superfamily
VKRRLNAMEMYHVSVIVEDLDRAMEDFASDFGITWRPVQGSVRRDVDGDRSSRSPKVTCSVEARPALELIEVGADDWRASGTTDTLHHLGFWVDDLPLATNQLIESGWMLIETKPAADGTPTNIAYLRSPYGLVVELVDVSLDRPWVDDLRPR